MHSAVGCLGLLDAPPASHLHRLVSRLCLAIAKMSKRHSSHHPCPVLVIKQLIFVFRPPHSQVGKSIAGYTGPVGTVGGVLRIHTTLVQSGRRKECGQMFPIIVREETRRATSISDLKWSPKWHLIPEGMGNRVITWLLLKSHLRRPQRLRKN